MLYRYPKTWCIKDDILYFLVDRLEKLYIEITNKRIQNKDYKGEMEKARILKKLIDIYQIWLEKGSIESL
ncbi:hypothetical protein DRN97_09080 [Methanosarcinales archaeon]|nr:MAG: hypothetical protein DRN97_09080 [Methanosarcinales archaeon]